MACNCKKLNLATTTSSYNILIGADITAADKEKIPENIEQITAGRNILIISDHIVAELYSERIEKFLIRAGATSVNTVNFTAGEESKNLKTVSSIYQQALSAGLDRNSLIIALGGGVVGDVAGFVAATYLRGIDFIQIPTTLLAMVDSSVGGKVGVDLPEGKNLVGAFYQPSLVIIDVKHLTTLPFRELRCGLAEVVKYGVIMDAEFFSRLEGLVRELTTYDTVTYMDVTEHCCRLKADVVEADEKELSGRRAILNYGHTFGHALEALMGYTGITHGEGVAIGMGMAADLAVILGMTERDTVQRQDALLLALGLPVKCVGEDLAPEAVYRYMFHDKKTLSNRLRLILPRAIGAAEMAGGVDKSKILQAIGGRCG